MRSEKELEIIENAKVSAQEMEQRVLSGEVINDFINDEKERILVTKTSFDKYGYAVFEEGASTPHYIVEGDYLISDLNKKTAHNGVTLRYPGAKSMIQRNMIGLFAEYIKDPGFESLYVSVQMPENSSLDVSQQMSGYYKEDAVSIFSANFRDKKFSYASFAQIVPDQRTGKPTLRIGMGGLDKDGNPDYETVFKMAKEAELAKRFFGEPSMSDDKLQDTIGQSFDMAQSVFSSAYASLGLPQKDGIEPSNLLVDAMQGKDISNYFGPEGFIVPRIEGPKK